MRLSLQGLTPDAVQFEAYRCGVPQAQGGRGGGKEKKGEKKLSVYYHLYLTAYIIGTPSPSHAAEEKKRKEREKTGERNRIESGCVESLQLLPA